MLLSFITPTPYIKGYQSQGDFILALSHLMNLNISNFYERAILATGLPIILDNGLFENHKPEGINSLLHKASRIGATHFFAPDHLYNAYKTQNALEATIYVAHTKGLDIKIGAVVQAETREDYIKQYKSFCEQDGVDLIGLSILSIPRCFGSWNDTSHTKKEIYKHKDSEITSSRIHLMKELMKLDEKYKKKPCHLLGLGDSYEDVIFAAKNCPWIVSNDTSSAFWNGLQGKEILKDGSVSGGKTDVKVDFDFKGATQSQLNAAQYNINRVKELIK